MASTSARALSSQPASSAQFFPRPQSSSVSSSPLSEKVDAIAKRKLQEWLETFQKYKEYYGNEPHPVIAKFLRNLGITYHSLKDYAKAREYYEAALDMEKKLYGDEPHPQIAQSLYELGITYSFLNDYAKAREYHEAALDMSKELYGDEPHPQIAQSLYELGIIYFSLRKYKNREYHEAALDMRKKLYSNKAHPDIAESLHSLGLTYCFRGNYSKAREYFEAALNMRKELYSDESHPDIVKSLNALQQVLNALKESLEESDFQEEPHLEARVESFGSTSAGPALESNLNQPKEEILQNLNAYFLEIKSALGVDIQKQIEDAVAQREQALNEEFQKIQNRMQLIQKNEVESQKDTGIFIEEETATLNEEIKSILICVDELKADLEATSKKQEEDEKALKGIQQDIKSKKVPKDYKVRVGELEGGLGKLKKEQSHLLEQYKLYEQEHESLQSQYQLLTDQQKTVEEKLKPLYSKYSQKEKILKEQQELRSVQEVHIFYKTLETMLGSKFQASILLTSGLIQRSPVKKDILPGAAGCVVECVFGLAAGMIAVGTLGASTLIVGAAAVIAGGAAGKGVEALAAHPIDKEHEGRAREISAAMSNPKFAWDVAELVSRKVTQAQIKLLEKSTAQHNEEWAKKAANSLYLFIASGEFKKKKRTTEAKMIKLFIKVIQEHIEREKSKEESSGKRCEIL